MRTSTPTAQDASKILRIQEAFRPQKGAGRPNGRHAELTRNSGEAELTNKTELTKECRYLEATVAARRLRPLARRRFRIARPDLVFIRSRKPCFRRRLIRLG